LRQKARVSERLPYDALAQLGDFFRHQANAIFVLRAEKERPQERAMDAIAERQPPGAHLRVQVGAKLW
jgi:hypothetical protein